MKRPSMPLRVTLKRDGVVESVATMKKIIASLVILIVVVSTPLILRGAELNHVKYPKLANIFFRWDITAGEAKILSKWDVLIIDMEVQTYSPASLKLLKKLNPNIKLLAYLASQEIRGDSGTLSGTLRQKLYNQIDSNWWLRNASGDKVAWWPGNPMINVTADATLVNNERWTDVLARFVKDELIDSGYWDGVFYDNAWDNLSFMKDFNIDLNQDGAVDELAQINEKWKNGMIALLKKTRSLLGQNALIAGNGGETYYQLLNGVLYEHFPDKGWADTLNKYRFINQNGYQPSLSILNSNVNNTGNEKNYQEMRFGLASALLDDGYYSFDKGDESHHEMWWYDEYETSLGQPAGTAFNVFDSAKKNFNDGVWRRDFKNGLVIVNSTNSGYDVDLGGEYEKLHGDQAPQVNDGSFVSSVEIPAKDGLVLLRPLDKILNATYINGSFAKVFNQYGHAARNGFFAYNDLFKGASQVVEKDLDADGTREFVVADASQVRVYDSNGKFLTGFYPYTEKFNKGVNITVGDLDHNGTMEIVTGTENGGGPQVRIFNSYGKLINPGFFAYAPSFRGGVNVAIADLEGDGWYEIVTGAGNGGGPHVRVFAPDGRNINPGFFAYDPKFRGGVNVAAGDVDGDGIDEIITGPGKGGAPQVKIFDRKGQAKGISFFAFDEKSKTGVEVAGTDLDLDGKAEVIATTSNVFTLSSY
ncbi:MAG: putative glycoside hydrolase [Patescibacteria group bacterium]